MQFSRHQPGIYRWYSPDGSYITCYTPGQYDEVGIPVREAKTDIKPLTKAFTSIMTEWNDYYKKRKIKPELQFLYSHDFATPPDYDAFFNDWNSKSGKLGKPSINYATATEWFDAVTKGKPEFDKILENGLMSGFIFMVLHTREHLRHQGKDHVSLQLQRNLQPSMLFSRDHLKIIPRHLLQKHGKMQSILIMAGEENMAI